MPELVMTTAGSLRRGRSMLCHHAAHGSSTHHKMTSVSLLCYYIKYNMQCKP